MLSVGYSKSTPQSLLQTTACSVYPSYYDGFPKPRGHRAISDSKDTTNTGLHSAQTMGMDPGPVAAML